MPAAELAPLLALRYPYPGLRPFEANEAFLFFGRQAHTVDLLKRLAAGRFLAVVGTSGSGKSSLVRAGLLPALYRGFLVGATSRWRIAVMRPGNAPLDNLAASLATAQVGPPNVRELIGRSSLGLTEAVRQTDLAAGESVLVVVDQFEELFRFQRERRSQDGGAEASLFISSLLEATEAFGVSVYVVITMRSDFLGDCTRFPGLAEALNSSQYLIPRLSREQRREAVVGPLQIAGGNMTDRLVQRLLYDLGDEPDQLPVLQHALNRTFSKWQQAGGVGDIDYEHYEAAGALSGSLNNHAEAILGALTPDEQQWTERVFRCLTTFDGGRAIRRPSRWDRLCAVAGAGTEDHRRAVAGVVAHYADPDNSLLVSSTGADLRPDTVIDISHESLIRNWKRLQQWLLDERDAVDWYHDVAEDVRLLEKGEASTWRDPKLEKAFSFVQSAAWNPDWAERNQPGAAHPYAAILGFLKTSADEQTAERNAEEVRRRKEIADAQALAASERKTKRITIGAAFVIAAVTLVAGFIWVRSEVARDQAERARAATILQATQASEAAALEKRRDFEAYSDQLKKMVEIQEQLSKLQQETGRSIRERTQLQNELNKLRLDQSAAQRVQAIKQMEQLPNKAPPVMKK